MKNDPLIPLRPVNAVSEDEKPEPEARDDLVFRFLTETTGAAMAWVDPRRRRVTGGNATFAELLGYPRDAVRELPIEAFADSFPRALSGSLTVTTGEDGRLSWESQWRRRDGGVVDVTVSALEVPRGDVDELLIVARPHDSYRHRRATVEAAREVSASDLTGVIWFDRSGRVIWADELAATVMRRSSEALAGATVADLLPALGDVWSTHWVRVADDGGASLEATSVAGDGAEFPCELACRAVQLDGAAYLCAFVADTSERELAHQRFLAAEERYALAAMGANDGLWDWDIVDGSIVYSSRWAALIGFSEQELSRTVATWLDRVHPDDRARVDAELASHLEGTTPHFESEHRIQHKDGTFRWVLFRGLAVRDGDGRAVRMAGSTSDVTHRKNAEARLRFEAFHDPLTGLANRALFIRRVQRALESYRKDAPGDEGFAVVVVDIDDFKLVNDSLGHTLGDMLLRSIASRLKRCVRAVDTVARLGSDEFCLLLEHVNDSDVLRVADRVQEEMGIPFNLRGYEIYTSASLGVAYSRRDYEEAEELLRDSNIAMFRAKREGRGRRAIFDRSMRRAAVNRLTLETDLRRAVERSEFTLYYQPVVALDSGTISGFEALARWNHPKRGVVMPGDFIPLAEETGLIVPLGRWVLVKACKEAVRWQELGLGPLTVNVNVSARQLALPYLVEQVAQVLEQTGLEAMHLNLEITESVLMDQAANVVAKLRELRRLGVGLHIDDFGTGYSSLAYLHRFPCDTLKIDKSFLLSNPAPDEDPWAIVKTIRSLAQLLGMNVTAEGVEQKEHLARLREIGCEHAQGFFMSRPVPADKVPALITSGKRW